MTKGNSLEPFNLKLFAVYLGGRAPKCNTELHDVVFTVGTTIEDTYERLLELWFGSPEGLHIDSWMELAVVDGYRIDLCCNAEPCDKKLFFVNLGAYMDGEFTELHANALVVASSEREVKSRAKAELLRGKNTVHTDDLFDIDDCLALTSVDGYGVTLTPTAEVAQVAQVVPNNGYHIIPRPIVEAYIEKQRRTRPS